MQLVLLPENILKAIGDSHSEDIAKTSLALRPIYYLLLANLLVILVLIVKLSFTNIVEAETTEVYTPKYFTDASVKSNGTATSEKQSEQGSTTQIIEILAQENLHQEKKLEQLMNLVCNTLQASIGAIYMTASEDKKAFIEFIVGYAFVMPSSEKLTFEFGEGLAGQVAKSGETINITAVPENYIEVVSGLGKATPSNLAIFPIIDNESIVGVLEIASFSRFEDNDLIYLEKVAELVAPEISKCKLER